MANTINIETLMNADYGTIIKVDIIGDGSGDETNTVIFDASSYANTKTKKSLFEVECCLTGFTAALIWDGTPDKQLITLNEHVSGHLSYEWCGGLPNSNVTSATGDILITTVGLGAGDRGYIILYVKTKELKLGTI